jgi:REP element-mobilizing transposase RayT
MQDGYKIRDQALPHFITVTVVDWIDVFTRKTYRDCVIECLDFCIKNKGMILYGYVIMSNHIHMIIQSSDGNLSDLIRDFKKFTAKTTPTGARLSLPLVLDCVEYLLTRIDKSPCWREHE